jgi:hypothetical protein
MENKMVNHLMTQKETQNFLINRGGNRGTTFDAWEGFKNTPKYEPDEKFYKGDKILEGNYFDGFNDTYFFNSRVFKENNNFWLSPFKKT